MNRLSVEQRLCRAAELGILVDEQDHWLLEHFSWRISTKGYVETTLYAPEKLTIKLHHLIMGRPLFGLQIDHDNRNKLDNRRANLMFRTNRDNQLNTDRVENAKNYKVSRNGRFEARVINHGTYVHLGTFDTVEEVEQAVEDYRRQSNSHITV